MRMITALLLSSITATLIAQPKTAPVDVVVEQVNDRRTNGSFSQLSVTLQLPKIPASDVAASRVLISAASDDSGRNLVGEENREPELSPNMSIAMGRKPAQPASVLFNLMNPSRKATALKEVRGEIELYMPSKDPNSVAEVAKFTSFAGKPLTHKALKANGVEIALLSNAQIEAERKKILDGKRKEFKEMGYEDGEELESLIGNYRDSTLPVEESDVLLRIKDPDARIQEIVYVDGACEVQRGSLRTDDNGLTYLSTWGTKPEAGWTLRVNMKTAKNIVRHAFVLKDVALP